MRSVANYKTYIKLVLRNKLICIELVLYSISLSVFTNLNIVVMAQLVNEIVPQSKSVPIPGTDQFSSIVKLFPNHPVLATMSYILIVVVAGKGLFTLLTHYYGFKLAAVTVEDLKKSMFRCIMRKRYSHFLSTKQGDLYFLCITAVDNAGMLVRVFVTFIVSNTTSIFIIALLAITNIKITIVMIFLGLTYFLLLRKISIRVSYGGGRKRIVNQTGQQVVCNEFLTGIKHIKAFGSEETWYKQFEYHVKKFRELYQQDRFYQALIVYVIEPVFFIAVAVVLIVMSYYQDAEVISKYLGVMAVFVLGLQKLIPAVNSVGSQRLQLLQGLPTIEKIYGYLDSDEEVFKDGEVTFSALKSEIEFRDICLKYGDNEVLKNINLKIPKNRMVAIVGPSGSGKTSIIQMLLRLVEPSMGDITIDGISLKELKIGTFTERIGYVGQDPFIFHGTVRDNVTFYDTKYSDEDVIRALEVAYAIDFVKEMPEGLDTIVGEKGMKISGGQQQRLTIARTVIKNPEIYVFDEATSSLDNISERMVQEAILNLSKETTVIVIAHRLTTVLNADEIMFLDRGRIIESGTHEQLMEKKGEYYKLYRKEE